MSPFLRFELQKLLLPPSVLDHRGLQVVHEWWEHQTEQFWTNLRASADKRDGTQLILNWGRRRYGWRGNQRTSIAPHGCDPTVLRTRQLRRSGQRHIHMRHPDARTGRHPFVRLSQVRRDVIPRTTRGGEVRKLRDIVHLASLGGAHDGGLRLLLGAGAISLISSGSRKAFRWGRNPNGRGRQRGRRPKDIHCNLRNWLREPTQLCYHCESAQWLFVCGKL